MYALDFEYDGQHLSDYKFIVCDFDGSTGAKYVSAGSKITFNTTPINRGKRHSLANSQYDECIQTTFDICKDPDYYEGDEMQITNDEYRDLMRWLNRSQFLKFQVIVEDDSDAEPCFYNGSFNIEKIKIREILYGLRLTLTTDKPFGYGMERRHNLIFNDPSIIHHVRDLSDDIGNTYPVIGILCKSDGNLSIKNSMTGCVTSVNNCVYGEKITIDCENHIITTSNTDHNVCNDFNYDYFSIGNTIKSRDNEITVSLPCEIDLRYFPIIKDTP